MRKKMKNYKYDMFLQDISNSIEFAIPEYRDSRKNITIESSEKYFKEYLEYKDYFYLEYDFLKEVARTISMSILKGCGIAKIIKYKDDSNAIKGIEIRNIDYMLKIKAPLITIALVKYPIHKGNPYRIKVFKNNEIIFLKRKKLKINTLKITKFLRYLKKADDYIILELLKQKLLLDGDYEKIKISQKVNLLKKLEKIKWDGRYDYDSFLNPPYILYRKVHWYIFLINSVNTTLNLINEQILKQKDLLYKRNYKNKF